MNRVSGSVKTFPFRQEHAYASLGNSDISSPVEKVADGEGWNRTQPRSCLSVLPSPPLSLQEHTHVPCVVQITVDFHLARTRALVMQQTEVVVRTLSPEEAASGRLPWEVCAVVLCQTLSIRQAASLFDHMSGSYPGLWGIRLSVAPAREPAIFNRVLQAPISPADLVSELVRLREARTRVMTLPRSDARHE